MEPEPEIVPSSKASEVRGRSVTREMVNSEMSEERGILSLARQLPVHTALSVIRLLQDSKPGGK